MIVVLCCVVCVIQTGLRYVFSAVTLKNNEAMEELLQSSIELALGNVEPL